MTTDTLNKTRAARRAIETLLTAANGGTMPRITVHVVDDATTALPPFDPDGMTETLVAAFDGNGRLDVAAGIRTHFTMLWHSGFRMARTPGGQLVLLGSANGRAMHIGVEDDRFSCDDGSPLLSVGQEQAAMAVFDAELAVLVAGVL